MPRLSVVIPCFNESREIVRTIHLIHSYLDQLKISHQIMVSDDGSSDGTTDVARQAAPDAPWLHVVRLQHGGKGRTVKKGILRASGELVLFCDADLSTPMDELPAFLDAIQKGADVVIASRDLPGSVLVIPQPLHRRLVGKLFRLFIQKLFQLPIQDTQCGFKLFTRKSARHIFRQQKIHGFTFDVEILYWAKILGYKTVELPVRWINRYPSRVSLVRDLFPIIRELFNLRLQFRRIEKVKK